MNNIELGVIDPLSEFHKHCQKEISGDCRLLSNYNERQRKIFLHIVTIEGISYLTCDSLLRDPICPGCNAYKKPGLKVETTTQIP